MSFTNKLQLMFSSSSIKPELDDVKRLVLQGANLNVILLNNDNLLLRSVKKNTQIL